MTTHIPLSTSKFARNLFMCGCFVLLSVWLIMMEPDPDNLPFRESVRYLSGWVGLAVFGIFMLVYIGLLIRRKPGLTLTTEGIIDHSSAVAAGFIHWRDISFFVTVKQSGQKFIAPILHNPEDYIKKASFWSRYFMRHNYNRYGSPVAITAVVLKASTEELLVLLEDGLERSKNES